MDTTTSVPMSVAQAAERAGVSSKTIRRWLSSGRLEASRGVDGTWQIDADALEQALVTPGLSVDSTGVHPGHVASMSIVQELLDRLERQAGEIATLRAQLEQAQRALPEPATQIRPQTGDSEGLSVEPTQTPSDPPRARPWWRRLLPA